MKYYDESLYEPMDMPDYHFPIKLLKCQMESGETLHQHWHPHIEINYILEGSMTICCDHNHQDATARDILIINSNELHSSLEVQEMVHYYTLIFDPMLLYSKNTDPCLTKFLEPILQNKVYFQRLIKHPSYLHGCIKAIIKEYEGKETGYELEIKSLLYHLVALLYRHYQSEHALDQTSVKRRKNLGRLSPVFAYIHEHSHEDISNQALADMMHITIYHFQRIFKETVGVTPTAYINRVKMDTGERLLQNSHLTINEIAEKLGYEASYFSRVFKQIKGCSPRDYRRGEE